MPKGSGPHLFLADKALGRLTLSLHRLVSSVRPGYITVTLAAPNVKRNKKGRGGKLVILTHWHFNQYFKEAKIFLELPRGIS